ncbi:hypothetical protein PENARI_c002G06315 [Penicillium arizonense]|uniref:CipC-like antibiotic response protein n=1 Tax=Penicillium arizonense TaxID=1835702 RepID=A0A1F5LUQ7_PENAI|nr:hypothetical protein PENARI_c002G06315 [Penicillium arizonense]OGE56924.1 hypothetical protein PENARI_c002G06315 [Penicillium arizonense]
MAWGWGESERAHEQVYNGEQHHEGKFSHEFAAGAASFAAMKAYEDHQKKSGQEVNHAFAKELLVGFVGGEIDKLAETKGMDWVDREKAKRHAEKNAHHMYEERYERGNY